MKLAHGFCLLSFLGLVLGQVACRSETGEGQETLIFVEQDAPQTGVAQQQTQHTSSPSPARFDPTISALRGELEASQPPRPVRFVAYNLWNYLNRARDGQEPRFKPEEQIAALVEVIVSLEPDILGISEIGTQEDLLDLQQRLAQAGLNLPAYAWTRGEDGVRNLALLSRFPITQASNPMLSFRLSHKDGTQVNTLMERGILDVSLRLSPDYELRTLGVHLKSKREVDYADQELIRSNEAQLLRDHAEAILRAKPETNLLLYGDFNDTARSRSLQILGAASSEDDPLALFDLPVEDENGDRWTHFWSWQDVYSRFDYIFYNAALKPELVAQESGILTGTGYRRASDHRPIYVVIDVRAEGS